MAFVLEMSIILHILLITVDRSVIMNIFLIIIKGVQFTFKQGPPPLRGLKEGGLTSLTFVTLYCQVLCCALPSHTLQGVQDWVHLNLPGIHHLLLCLGGGWDAGLLQEDQWGVDHLLHVNHHEHGQDCLPSAGHRGAQHHHLHHH